ncbi:hypothetical protein WA026_009249 [Henosepilachna vigintioctopunctata]|uniref:PiggyBac transposable element-derived protein domain-containing protein n=1 Tax=Henosepilachna vigintioctopunctata TaxID=420089 RepID=A0AAW1UQB7_9CUCU
MTSKSTIIESWLEEELENEDCALDGNFSDVEDIDDDFVLAQEVGSDSEIDGDDINLDEDCVGPQAETDSLGIYTSDDEVPLAQVRSRPRKKNYLGKNRFRWSPAPPSSRTRTLQHNIVQQKEGIQPAYKSVITSSSSEIDIWNQFITNELLEQIVLHTNEKIRAMRPHYKKQSCVQDLDAVELSSKVNGSQVLLCV